MENSDKKSDWVEYVDKAKKVGYFKYIFFSILFCTLVIILGVIRRGCFVKNDFFLCTKNIFSNIDFWQRILFIFAPLITLIVFVIFLMAHLEKKYHLSPRLIYYTTIFFLGISLGIIIFFINK